MKYSLCNIGCKVNAYEAESIASQFDAHGWDRVPFDEESDVAMIFTCAVTNIAAQKSRKMMHRIKKNYPNTIIAMVGCYVQLDDTKLDDADIIVGTTNKKNLYSYVEEYLEYKKPIHIIDDMKDIPFDDLNIEEFSNRARAFLRIQDGCNQFCAYCTIPYARGRERSMEKDKVIENLKSLSKHHEEIVLTGIHTGRYGHEFNYSLAQLLEDAYKEIPDLGRIRISSIEITEVTDELISLMQKEKRIARHLHIPLQAGTDKILKAMNRPYTCDEYLNRLNEIREALPHISISTDVIVGFPGESENDFKESLSFMRKCAFSFLHVFPYSKREGTVAATMDHQLTMVEKKKRVKECLALSSELEEEYAKTFLNQEVEVLAEEVKDKYTKGYSSEYVSVLVEGNQPYGKIISVSIKDTKKGQLIGEKV